MTTIDNEVHIGPSTLRRIAAAWPRRASVRSDMQRLAEPGEYLPDVPDYPARLLPFGEHPLFLAAAPEQQARVLTMAWLVYNERVVAVEEHVANPTFAMIVHGVFPGADRPELRQAVQQAHVDETWHTYLHMMAMQRTREARPLAEPGYPDMVTLRRLRAAQADVERWERDLLALVWTTVAETTVNGYLELLARDRTIQPLHALIPQLHARDEAAHSSVMVEVAKQLYVHLSAAQRDAFAAALPRALHAFAAEDYQVWPAVLGAAGIARGDEIVADVRAAAAHDLMVLDFAGARRIVRELDLADRVEFDFGPDPAGQS